MKAKRLLFIFSLLFGTLMITTWGFLSAQQAVASQSELGSGVKLIVGKPPAANPIPFPDTLLKGELADGFMGSTILIQDINGDFNSDVIVGAPFVDAPDGFGGFRVDAGAVYIYTGTASSTFSLTPTVIFGRQAGEQFGTSLLVGDFIYEDNLMDLLVGAPYYDDTNTNLADAGAVYVFTGTTSVPTNEWPFGYLQEAETPRFVANMSGSEFGYSMEAIDSLTSSFEDFIPELAIGAPTYNNNGAVFLYASTPEYPDAPTASIAGTSAQSRFGHALQKADMSGFESENTILIGAPNHTEAGFPNRGGAVFGYEIIFSFPDSFVVDPMIVTLFGDRPDSAFGWSLDSGYLFDDDSIYDVVIGAPGYTLDGTRTEGAAFAYSGIDILLNPPSREPELMPTVRWFTHGRDDGGQFGYSVEIASASSSDSFPDIVVGAKTADINAFDAGAVYMFLTNGTATIPQGFASYIMSGNGDSAFFGSATAFGYLGNSLRMAVGGTGMDLGGAVSIYDITFADPIETFPIYSQDGPKTVIEPVNFTVTPTFFSIPASDLVYYFEFGDGTALVTDDPTGLETQEVSHHYPAPGTYPLTLLMMNPSSNPVLLTDTVEILAGAVGTLTVNASSPTQLGNPTGFIVNLENPASSTNNVLVDFGDDSLPGFIQFGAPAFPLTFQHVYTAVGEYTATVYIDNDLGGSDVVTTTVIVEEPITGLLLENTSPTRFSPAGLRATGFRVTFDSGDPVTLTVDVGNGTEPETYAKVSSPFVFSYTYQSPGLYTATALANNQVSVDFDRSLVAIYVPGDVTPGGGGSGGYDDSSGARLDFAVPPGAVDRDVEIRMTPRTGPGDIPSPPTNTVRRPILYFDFEVEEVEDEVRGPLAAVSNCIYLPYVVNGEGTSSTEGTNAASTGCNEDFFSFLEPVSITIQYPDSVIGAGESEEDLFLFFYDTTVGQWVDGATTCVPRSTYVRDTDNNTITVQICHQSRWGFGIN